MHCISAECTTEPTTSQPWPTCVVKSSHKHAHSGSCTYTQYACHNVYGTYIVGCTVTHAMSGRCGVLGYTSSLVSMWAMWGRSHVWRWMATSFCLVVKIGVCACGTWCPLSGTHALAYPLMGRAGCDTMHLLAYSTSHDVVNDRI